MLVNGPAELSWEWLEHEWPSSKAPSTNWFKFFVSDGASCLPGCSSFLEFDKNDPCIPNMGHEQQGTTIAEQLCIVLTLYQRVAVAPHWDGGWLGKGRLVETWQGRLHERPAQNG